MAKVSTIEAELTKGLKVKPGKDRKAFLGKLLSAYEDLDDKGAADEFYEALSKEAQRWLDENMTRSNKSQPLTDFNDDTGEAVEAAEVEQETVEASEVEPEAEEVEETVTKKAPAKKGAAKAEKETAVAKAAKKKATTKAAPAAKKVAEKKAAPAKAAKPAKVAKAKAEKKGRKPRATNGAVGFTDKWAKVLGAIGKKGASGVTRADIAVYCEKFGLTSTCPPLSFQRFVNCGYLKRVERGIIALTAAGQKAVDNHAAA